MHALNDQRNALMAELEERGIATRQGTHSPVLTRRTTPTKYDLRPEDFPRSILADRLSLALPLYPQMTDAEQETGRDRAARRVRRRSRKAPCAASPAS